MAYGPTAPRVRYAVVMPVRDEEQFLEGMIESVLAQSILPRKWIIVDDGSTDRTPEILDKYARSYSFLEVVHLPARMRRAPGGEDAVGHAIRLIDWSQYDFLARFDADLVFESDYMRQLLIEFEKNVQLGIAGGGLYVRRKGTLELERVPQYHVRGALKVYRRECFQQIGGLCGGIGWDTIDEVRAWINGWTTKSFFEYKVIHCRPTGSGISASRLQKERGRAEYLTWSWPPFVAAKALKVALTTRSILLPCCYVGGFLSCYLRSQKRIDDPQFVRARRHQQRRRLRLPLGQPPTEFNTTALGA